MCFWYVPNGVHLPTWFPQQRGDAGRPARDAPAALVRPRLSQLLPRPDAQHGPDQRRQRRLRPRPGLGELPDRCPGLQDAGCRPRRHLGRPALRATRRQRDPLPQPRAGLRVGPLRERVRLQRDVQDAHLLADADLARPLRDESQGRLRSPVHQGEQQPDAGHGRRSRLLPQEHDRLRAGRRQPHPQSRRQDRSAQARPVPDRRPRGRAPHPASPPPRSSCPGPISSGPRASRRTSTSTCG